MTHGLAGAASNRTFLSGKVKLSLTETYLGGKKKLKKEHLAAYLACTAAFLSSSSSSCNIG